MPIWPFRRPKPRDLSPEELRDVLFDAARSGSRRKLRRTCQLYARQAKEHVTTLSRLPEGRDIDDQSLDQHIQSLGAVAQCLANDCNAPELWNHLCGSEADNPLLYWDRWYGELPERMQQLEYDALIEEAEGFVERVKELRGSTARRHDSWLNGRLGELLFHSGRAAEALVSFQEALDICVESGDVEGEIAYLSNMTEAHCYLEDGQAIEKLERLKQVAQRSGQPTKAVERRLNLQKQGVPLCRVVCIRDGEELELDEISNVGEGRYQFVFQRNRLPLAKASTLTSQGNRLASDGQFAAALEKYSAASDVDPYDPDPVYQSGMCLIDLGMYAQARDAFDDVEHLAPGWFRCRTDRWLAAGLDDGTISKEEVMLLRFVEDGGLPRAEAVNMSRQGLERYPTFAPLYLLLGDAVQDESEAISAYRKGLEHVQEPDLKTRLLCALAGRLLPSDPERKTVIEKALEINGSLIAQASARLMLLQ